MMQTTHTTISRHRLAQTPSLNLHSLNLLVLLDRLQRRLRLLTRASMSKRKSIQIAKRRKEENRVGVVLLEARVDWMGVGWGWRGRREAEQAEKGVLLLERSRVISLFESTVLRCIAFVVICHCIYRDSMNTNSAITFDSLGWWKNRTRRSYSGDQARAFLGIVSYREEAVDGDCC